MAEETKFIGSTIEEVRAVKPLAAQLFEKSGVLVGIGITKYGSGYGLKVNLRGPLEQSADLPEQIKGVPLQVEVVGPIRKQSVR